MCRSLLSRTQEIWLLGPSVEAVWSLLHLSKSEQDVNTFRSRRVADWESFRRAASTTNSIWPKRLVLVADVSVLSHETIFQIRHLKEQNPLFSPVIYFDQPDLGKFIHTFNSDLAGYCAAIDTKEEIGRLLGAICAGKHYYSPGFCQMVEDFGFPIARGDEGECIKN